MRCESCGSMGPFHRDDCRRRCLCVNNDDGTVSPCEMHADPLTKAAAAAIAIFFGFSIRETVEKVAGILREHGLGDVRTVEANWRDCGRMLNEYCEAMKKTDIELRELRGHAQALEERGNAVMAEVHRLAPLAGLGCGDLNYAPTVKAANEWQEAGDAYDAWLSVRGVRDSAKEHPA